MSIIQHLAVLAIAIVFGIAIKKEDKYESTSPVMCAAIMAIVMSILGIVFVAQHSTELDKGFLIAYALIAAFSYLLKFG